MLETLTMCPSGRSSRTGRNARFRYTVPHQFTGEDTFDRRVVQVLEPFERLDDPGAVDETVDGAEARDHGRWQCFDGRAVRDVHDVGRDPVGERRQGPRSP